MKHSEPELTDPKRIVNLILKVGLNTITGEEQRELDQWVTQSEDNRETLKEMIRLCSPDYTDKIEKGKQESIEKLLKKINQTEG